MAQMKAQKAELWTAERIIELMEDADLPPWRKPWNGGDGIPKNACTGRTYSGMNLFLLLMTPYADKRFLTPAQVKKAGGNIKKGEKTWPVYFWKFPTAQEQKEGKFPFCKYYKVVNIAQTEDVDESKLKTIKDETDTFEHTPIEVCEHIVKGFKDRPPVEHGGNRACYSPTFDKVMMPNMEQFPKVEEYYSTLFHELAHSTGHESRLDRPELMHNLAGFGSHEYSQEELVAEFTAAQLCGEAGVSPLTLENSAAYIKGWYKKLKRDPEMLVFACRQANKAVRYIRQTEDK